MTPIHLLDIGPPIDDSLLRVLLKSQGRSELVLGVLQILRDTALDAAADAAAAIGASDAVMHAKLGRYDGLANVLVELYRMTMPEESQSQEEDMLSEVPRV